MIENKGLAEQTVVVILAAGKGTRMGRPDLGKVCFEIDSVPAINRIIGVFKRKRFEKFLVVVGSMAEQVLSVVGREHPGVMYVYQQPQLGTGHAAKAAADALQNIEYDGNVLVTMGDKFIEPEAIESLIAGYVKQHADLALLTFPKGKATDFSNTRASMGTVFVDADGQARDIIEKTDRARLAIADELREKIAKDEELAGSDVLGIIRKHIEDPGKQTAAIGGLLALAKAKKTVDKSKLVKLLQSPEYRLEIDGKRYSARQLERICKGVNPSLYLFRAEAFYQGVGMIDNHNAQGEYYLTDVVRLLAGLSDSQGRRRFKIRAVPADDPDWVQGFNSPDELLAIQDYVRRKKLRQQENLEAASRPRLKPNQYCTVRQWIAKIEARKPGLNRWLRSIYGPHDDLHRQKCRDLIGVLGCYAKRFGTDQRVCIVRAPGRINLMGRHVDHRGGLTNFLAIERETMAVVGLRSDNDVVAVNTQPRKFKPVRFNVSQLIGRFAWSDWLNFVNSDWVRNMLYSAAGDWGNYIKAAVLRLQHRYQDVRIRGLNLALCGNVPIAAGLSSSSTIVVATLQAAIALNSFELTSQQFIDLCGEGEWFVGSRGGAGDHAAIYLGQRGKIAHVGYLPFRLERIIDAPRDYQVIIANSHIKAAKSSAARHTFNARVASYNLGLALLKQRCPEMAETVEYVRDINPATIGCATSEIYRWLQRVPPRMTRRDFQSMLSKRRHQMMEANFATHAEPDHYNPRGVLLFGASEIIRSRMCVDYLEAGQVERFGRLMKVSHDGDRVSRPGPDGKYRPAEQDSSDEYLNRLITDLAGEDPEKVLKAQLYMQPGSYACSTPEIDQMIDIVSSVPGVAGAQIAGAGLGGCIMILARKDRVEAARKALIKHYYRP
ncbi:MAG: GHMP family kinase ATP-binding protein, partial [Planctomycetota bacterium]